MAKIVKPREFQIRALSVVIALLAVAGIVILVGRAATAPSEYM